MMSVRCVVDNLPHEQRVMYLENPWFRTVVDQFVGHTLPALLEGLAAIAERKNEEQEKLITQIREGLHFDGPSA